MAIRSSYVVSLQGREKMAAAEVVGSSSPVFLTAQARAAVDMCIDALCFQSTHIVDDEGAVCLKESLPKLLQLKEEQKRRIEQQYSPKELHPDALADQLMELYGADAKSLLERADPNEPSVVDNLTDFTAKIFKKEMKQRIHDWEGAFRATYDREAGPQDKMRLRSIYELYKAVKNRVIAAPAAVPVASEQQQQPSRPTAGTPSVRSGLQAATTPNRVPEVHQDPFAKSTPASVTRPTPTSVSRATPHSAPRTAAPYSVASSPGLAAAAANTSLATPAGASVGRTVSGGYADAASAVPTLAALGLASLHDAVQEKRQLKRQLHEFEDQFKQQHGAPPTRDDRRPFAREYHRYGELKALLANAGQTAD